MATLKDIGDSLRGLFEQGKTLIKNNPGPTTQILQKGVNFLNQYPTPASFIQKQVYNAVDQSIPGGIKGGTQRVLNSFQNPSQYNFYGQAAKGNLNLPPQLSSTFKPIGEFIGNYVQNRYVNPITSLPANLKETLRTDKPLLTADRGKAAIGTAVGVATLFPDPIQDFGMPVYDLLKGSKASQLRGENWQQNMSSGLKAMSMQEQVGLGDAITNNELGKAIGNLAELPLSILMTAKIGRGQKLGFNKNVVKEARQAFSPEVRKIIGEFASIVEENPNVNKSNLGEIGDYMQTVAEGLFGSKAANLNNKQMKNLFDVLLYQVDQGMPRTRFPIGLNATSIREGMDQTESAAKARLRNLLTYQSDLQSRGFTANQLKFIDAKEARNILDNGISPLDHISFDKARAQTVQSIKSTVKNSFSKNDLDGIETAQRVLDPDFSPISVKNKVNILDYIRTPEKVLEKIGLKDESKYLRKQYESYLSELPEHIEQITKWQKQVPSAEGNEKIFRYLDGENISLNSIESRVAMEVQAYLANWATRLKLPPEKRVSRYITRIWSKGEVEQEFPAEIAKQIEGVVPGGVYDPFLLKRTGGRIDYLRDTWKSLDAYAKRAVRKANLDPALEQIKAKSEGFELSQYKYIQKFTERLNMRPTEFDTLVDNFIKSTPIGYKFGPRPVTAISKSVRQMIFRGALGLNFGSATRNLTQVSNTYAEIGEKWTAVGYLQLLKKYGSDELERVGVLSDSFIQDRNIGVYKSFLSKVDKGLFFLFEQAEKINRGAAYYGAKAKALAKKGTSEAEAIEYAKSIVRKTQFQFGSLDTPLALSSDISKTFTQFLSFPLKQAEFLADKVVKKDVVGIVRYVGATIALQQLLSKAFNMKSGDADQSTVQGKVINTLPSPFGYQPPVMQIGQALLNARQFLSPDATDAQRERAIQDILKAGSLVVPGGVQLKKTLEGVESINKGYVGKDDAIKFPVEPTTSNTIKSALFGQYSTPEASEYFAENRRPLSEKQSKEVRDHINRLVKYQEIIRTREENKVEDQVREVVRQTGVSSWAGDKYLYFDTKSGDIKSIDSSFEPTQPQYTGSEALDKQLKSRYSAEISKRENIITDLFEQGQLTQDQANSEFEKISQLRGEKTTLEDEMRAREKTKLSSEKKQVVEDFAQGLISKEEASSKLEKINLALTTGKTKKAKKLTFKVAKAPKITNIKIRSPKMPKLSIKKPKKSDLAVKTTKIPKAKNIKAKTLKGLSNSKQLFATRPTFFS